jgi:hypothetical protein
MLEGLIFLSTIIAVGLVIMQVIKSGQQTPADAEFKPNAGRRRSLQKPFPKKNLATSQRPWRSP